MYAVEIFGASALQARRCRERKLADRTMVLHYFALGGATVDTVSDDDDFALYSSVAWIP